MKLFVKSLKGNHFQIQVNPHDTVGDVKKNIESVQGANVYPVSHQMLIYQGKALMDGTTLEENNVAENSFIVVMLLKSKSSSGNSSVAAAAVPTSKDLAIPISPIKASASSTRVTNASSLASTPNSMPSPKTIADGSTPKLVPAPVTLAEISTHKSPQASRSLVEESIPKSSPTPKSLVEDSIPKSSQTPKFLAEASTSSLKPVTNSSPSVSLPAKLPTPESPIVAATSPSTIVNGGSSSCATKKTKIPKPKSPSQASTSSSTTVTSPSPVASTPKLPASTKSFSLSSSEIVDQAASDGLESTIQHIIDIGGGIWDRDTVESALHAACNDPERAVDYLYSEIPKQAEVPFDGQSIKTTNPTKLASPPPSRPNSSPSDIFPLEFLHLGSDAAPMGALDFLRNSEQFQVLRAMVRANPQVLQPMLQEFGQRNPNLMRLIREHQNEFQQLLNEPFEGEGNILGQFSAVMPQSIQVTPKERAAIERLEAMGFDRSTVLEAYFACNKNEALTANYLLDHMHGFEY